MSRIAPTTVAAQDAYAVHPDAVAVTAFRPLRDGTGRQYTATTFPGRPWAGCERVVRMGKALGYIRPSSAEPDSGYAVLDILNDDGDIIQDFEITTARAFRWMKKRYDWRVEEGSP